MKKLKYALACLIAVSIFTGCRQNEYETGQSVSLHCITGPETTRSADPEDGTVTDLNVLIFRQDGSLEEKAFVKSGGISRTSDGCTTQIRLVKGAVYDFYVCANLGYRIPAATVEEIREFRYHLAYPDEFHGGVPMSGCSLKTRITDDASVDIPLTRALAKLTVRIDRRQLDKDVSFNVLGVKIGANPKSVNLFKDSRAESTSDVFNSGFSKDMVEPLNRNVSPGLSGGVDLWMPENLQGHVLDGIRTREDRIIPPDSPASGLCSYIELTAEYDSDSLYSKPGSHLTYRFYLGDTLEEFDVRRNCHYTITVTPRGSGLDGNDWRIERGEMGVHWKGTPYLKYYPGTYIECRRGDKVRVWCEIYPPDAPFDIGMEELEFDRERGIYDFEVDEDGLGVTLTMKNKGTGILHPWAGPPIDDHVAIMVVCEP